MSQRFTSSLSSFKKPSLDARNTRTAVPPRFRKSLEAWLDKWIGRYEGRQKRLNECLYQGRLIAEMDADVLSIKEIKTKLHYASEMSDDLKRHALKRAANIASNTLKLRAYPVQLSGAWGLLNASLVEMGTGEGKTLSLALAAAVRAWKAGPVKILTANDYLAQRDADQYRPFYESCGLKVTAVTGESLHKNRRDAYKCDIVYTTARELAGDFLRDKLSYQQLYDSKRRGIESYLQHRDLDPPARVLRGFDTVLVDEADSLLIDEAITPLIISQSSENDDLEAVSLLSMEAVQDLVEGKDYECKSLGKQIYIQPECLLRVRNEISDKNPLFKNIQWLEQLLEMALRTLHFYERDVHYMVQDNKIKLIDESTGRTMKDRSLSQGMHQMLEAKEGLSITAPTLTLSSISFQQFFRQIPFLAGMSGTVKESRDELWRIYRLSIISLPTHRACLRQLHPMQVCVSLKEKENLIVQCVREQLEKGCPVLVGTRSLAASEALSSCLEREGFSFSLLNARADAAAREAEIIQGAGQRMALTVATNMAGRGTDICLSKPALIAGGLTVISVEPNYTKRVDRQLYGRCARQGDPGLVYPYASIDDEVVTTYIWKGYRRVLQFLLRNKIPGSSNLSRYVVYHAQRKATKQQLKQRFRLLKADESLNKAFHR